MRKPRRYSTKLLAAFFGILTVIAAQDPTSFQTPDVVRVGTRLACRCGTCRNTVGDCPMLHCSSSSPKRQRIFEMKQQGLSDDAIVSTFVREEGIVALSSPPGEGIGPLLGWFMPAIALIGGFIVYSWFVRRNRKDPETLQPGDQAVLDRFRTQIDQELEDGPSPR